MRWLLDTNVISEGIRPQPDRAVVGWLAARSPELLAVSMVTLAELHHGTAVLSNEKERLRLMRWIETEITEFFQGRVLPLTLEILIDWLTLSRRLERLGRPRSAPDLLIAATARVHEMIVVSRNTRDFADTGVVLFDPWTGQTHRMESS